MAITLVQHGSNTGSFSTGTTGTVTVTMGASITAGSCLVACTGAAGGTGANAVTGIKTNTNAENWAAILTALENPGIGATCSGAIWADPNTGGGTTSVVVSFSLTGAASTTKVAALVDVFEVSGLAATFGALTDKTNSGTGSATSAWSSGASGTTTNATEFVVATSANYLNTTFTQGTPTGAWTNETNLSASAANTGFAKLQSGFQITTTTGTFTYNATASSGSILWGVAVATLFPAPPQSATAAPLDGPVRARQPLGPRGAIRSGKGAYSGQGPAAPTVVPMQRTVSLPFRSGWMGANHSH